MFPNLALYLVIMIVVPEIAVLLAGGLFALCRTLEQRERLLVLAAIDCARSLSLSSGPWYLKVGPSQQVPGLLPHCQDTERNDRSPGADDWGRRAAKVLGDNRLHASSAER